MLFRSDTFTVDNRQAIIESIKQLKDALYKEGDADSSGRYLFTGYRTDRSLTFQNDSELNVSYRINQKFTGDGFTSTSFMKNSVDVNNIADIPAAGTPESEDFYRLRLAYQNCAYDANDATTLPTIKVDGQNFNGTVRAVTE